MEPKLEEMSKMLPGTSCTEAMDNESDELIKKGLSYF